MNTLIKQLDLSEHFDALAAFFARPKGVEFDGDVQQMIVYLQELDKQIVPQLPQVGALTPSINRLAKQGHAKLGEIYDFVRIARFFELIKTTIIEGKCAEWLRSIEIAKSLKTVAEAFNENGEVVGAYSEELVRLKRAIEERKNEAKTVLLRLASSEKLVPYLIDRQAHLVGGEETLLVRGGFNHLLAGRVVDRTSAGFFYVAPRALSDLRNKIEDLKNDEQNEIAKVERVLSEKLQPFVKFLRFLDVAFDRFDHLAARLLFAKSRDLTIIAPKSGTKIVLNSFAHPLPNAPK